MVVRGGEGIGRDGENEEQGKKIGGDCVAREMFDREWLKNGGMLTASARPVRRSGCYPSRRDGGTSEEGAQENRTGSGHGNELLASLSLKAQSFRYSRFCFTHLILSPRPTRWIFFPRHSETPPPLLFPELLLSPTPHALPFFHRHPVQYRIRSHLAFRFPLLAGNLGTISRTGILLSILHDCLVAISYPLKGHVSTVYVCMY